MQSCMVTWFAEGMASADAYDWRGDSYGDLARAHELPIPTIESLRLAPSNRTTPRAASLSR